MTVFRFLTELNVSVGSRKHTIRWAGMRREWTAGFVIVSFCLSLRTGTAAFPRMRRALGGSLTWEVLNCSRFLLHRRRSRRLCDFRWYSNGRSVSQLICSLSNANGWISVVDPGYLAMLDMHKIRRS